METTEKAHESVALTVSLVSSYCSHNPVSRTDLPALISEVHKAVGGLYSPIPATLEQELTPAVPVRNSITPEFIICLEDGKKFKSLKRHLRIEFDMSPEEYRAKWNLPGDYPMVAPSYSAQRSQLAKTIGLGKKN